MEKDLNWAAIKEDEGKYALGYILAKELENQAFLRGSENVIHVGAFVTIDLLGNLKIGSITPFLPPEMEHYREEDKIKIAFDAKLSEEEIIKLLT